MNNYELSLAERVVIYCQLLVLDSNSIECRLFNSSVQACVESNEEEQFIKALEYVILFFNKIQKDKSLNKQHLINFKQCLFELTADYEDLQKKIK